MAVVIGARPSTLAEVPPCVARALGWNGEGDAIAFLDAWRPAPEMLDPWARVAEAFAEACIAWLIPALRTRQGQQIIVLALTVGSVDPLAGPVLRWDVWRGERETVRGWPSGDEMLEALDLIAATGRASLLVVFSSDTQSKGVGIGLGAKAMPSA